MNSDTTVTSVKLNLRDKIKAHIIEKHRRVLLLPCILGTLLIILLVVSSAVSIKARANLTGEVHDNNIAVADKTTKLTFVGDIMLGRNIAKLAKKIGYDKLFIPSAKLFADSDMVMANLDTTVLAQPVENYSAGDKHLTFHTQAANISYLKNAGIDVLSLATDHIADYGRETLQEAFDAMDLNQITYVGAGVNNIAAGAYKLFNANGATVAVMGATDFFSRDISAKEGFMGVFPVTNANSTLIVNDAADKSDIVVVYMHWGDEYMLSETDDMRALAHKLIDAGADIVIGSNPRVVLPIETYKWGIIAYSVGSYIFDDASSRACDSIAFNYLLEADGNARVEVIPMRLNAGIPTPTTTALYVNRIFTTATKNLDKSAYTIDGEKLIINMPPKKLAQ